MIMSEPGYRGLVVWQKAKALAVQVYELTRSESIKRDYALVDQLRRSAVSVPSNIAKGSLAELSTQLEIAREVGYFPAAQVEPLLTHCAELAKMLGAMIRVRSASPPVAPSPEPHA